MHRKLTDERIRAKQLYCEEGITSYVKLADRVGVSRETISAWAKEENWEKQRAQTLTTGANIARKIVKVLSKLVTQVEEVQDSGKTPMPEEIDRMLKYAETIRQLNEQYDRQGATVIAMNDFVDFVSMQPNEQELLKSLQRMLPKFFDQQIDNR